MPLNISATFKQPKHLMEPHMPLDDSIRYRAENLLLRYREETGADSLDADAAGLIAWLNKRVVDDKLSSLTAKCYRRWIAAYLEDIEHPSSRFVRNWLPPGSREAVIVEDDKEAGDLIQHLQLMGTDNNSIYASYIDQEGFKSLMRQLVEETPAGAQRYKGGENIVALLVLTAMTGLRPMEWPQARLLDSYYCPNTKLTLGPVLEVRTLKQSGRRDDNPLKPKRHLLLDEWPSEQLDQLKYFMDEVVGSGDFKKWYNTSRATLSRAWKRLCGATGGDAEPEGAEVDGDQGGSLSVTFYTARHIFAEEVRRSLKYTRYELAAMLGHSMLTNQKYYGPRDSTSDRGFSFVLPRPWPGDADEIMTWDKHVNPVSHRVRQGDLFFSETPMSAVQDSIAEFYMR
jgi:integrase